MQQEEKWRTAMENFAIFLFCMSFTSTFITSMSLDTIAPDELIRDGQTIVSASGNFELGFFRPGASNFRYLGIWYKKISNGTVVWIANREIPLTDSSGVLKLNNSGSLILLDKNNTIIWSSDSSRLVHNPVAQILDSGNLVIRDENELIQENFLWQSFDYPDKTFLPGMKIGRTANGLVMYISSWKSIDDPSFGNFTYQVDPSSLQIILKENSAVKARYGPWNGIQFSGVPYPNPSSIINFTYVFNQKEAYYTYEPVNSSVFSRLLLDHNGILGRFIWNDQNNDWFRYIYGSSDNCDTYALCGAYGNCDIRYLPLLCRCLDRFVPKYEQEWDGAYWSSGCVRRTPLDCQKGDGFIRYSNVKLPDMKNSSTNSNMTLEECEMTCLKDCSCMAYANSDIRGSGSGCFFWFDELVDIRELTEDGQDLYIRMASSEKDTKISRKSKVIIASTVPFIGMIFLGLVFHVWRKKLKDREVTGNLETCANNMNQKDDLQLPLFDLGTIARATNDFSITNKLGEGGFGSVYMGVLKDGQEIAVKRLSKNSKQGINEFKNEVVSMAKLQHRNLVKLLGCCIQADEKMLIYELMPNKSLDFFIFDRSHNTTVLDWPVRFHIINGIARGLLYLHQDSRLRIIHRDLKAGNILLDYEMNPKISDFGLARSFGGNETEGNTNKVMGTFGYISPEYAVDGTYSVKSDVFSFGVIVLEIVSGKRNRGFCDPKQNLNLLGHAWRLHKEGRSIEMIDTLVRHSCNISEVLRSVHIGLLCVQQSPEARPSMSTVIFMLGSESELPKPKQPGFFTGMNVNEASSSSNMEGFLSANGLSITFVEAR